MAHSVIVIKGQIGTLLKTRYTAYSFNYFPKSSIPSPVHSCWVAPVAVRINTVAAYQLQRGWTVPVKTLLMECLIKTLKKLSGHRITKSLVLCALSKTASYPGQYVCSFTVLIKSTSWEYEVVYRHIYLLKVGQSSSSGTSGCTVISPLHQTRHIHLCLCSKRRRYSRV